jgi:hypothetical protein
MECGFQEKDSPLIQNWGSKISAFYKAYYIEQYNITIVKILHKRDHEFLAMQALLQIIRINPLGLMSLLEGLIELDEQK